MSTLTLSSRGVRSMSTVNVATSPLLPLPLQASSEVCDVVTLSSLVVVLLSVHSSSSLEQAAVIIAPTSASIQIFLAFIVFALSFVVIFSLVNIAKITRTVHGGKFFPRVTRFLQRTGASFSCNSLAVSAFLPNFAPHFRKRTNDLNEKSVPTAEIHGEGSPTQPSD